MTLTKLFNITPEVYQLSRLRRPTTTAPWPVSIQSAMTLVAAPSSLPIKLVESSRSCVIIGLHVLPYFKAIGHFR